MLNIVKRWIFILTITTPIIMSCSTKQDVDLIVKNAKIYTVDSSFSIYESMATHNGKVISLGTSQEIDANYTSKNVYDLKGKPVYPGFIDPHCHFLSYGLGLRNAWLSGTSSWKEVVDRLAEHHKNYPSEWVLGRGWNQTEWDVKEFPTKELLDEVFPENPVLLTRIDGHAAIANSKALKMAGFNPDSTVAGGDLIKQNGQLTGVLIDNAIYLVRNLIPEYSEEEKKQALLNAQANCFAVGLTSIGDAGMNLADIQLIDSLQKVGSLKMKVNVMLNPTPENFSHFVKNGIYQTPQLTVRTIKLFADGALGSRGAWLLEPYSDAPETIGLQLETYEQFYEYSKKAFDAGYQVAVHCIGDAAVRIVLDVYEEFLSSNNDLRWRIEHAQTVHPEDLHRFGKFNVVPSIQTTHATSDMIWAAERLDNRIKTAYIYQDLLQQNGWLPNGSDFPIEHINPLYGFYAGVVRKNLSGYPTQGFQMENAITREQALKAMTIWAAKAAFEEEIKGSLEPGKVADFVVLEKDLMESSENELPNIQVMMTFVDGKVVYLNQKEKE